MNSDIRYYSYPLTQQPPEIASEVVRVFRSHESELSTRELSKENRLKSDSVLETVRPDLEEIGFSIEGGSRSTISLPLLYDENGSTEYAAEVDGYLEEEKCVLEVEAGRGWESNAIHRNLVRTMAIDGADILILAIPNVYKRKRSTRPHFDEAEKLIRALSNSPRVDLPYQVVLLGY